MCSDTPLATLRANACMGEGGGRGHVCAQPWPQPGLNNAYQNPFSGVLHGRKSHLLTVGSENIYCKREDCLPIALFKEDRTDAPFKRSDLPAKRKGGRSPLVVIFVPS